jgi:hypothetical protein
MTGGETEAWVDLAEKLFGVQTDAAAWAKGCKGEELVAKQLGTLGPEWHVLHSIQVGTTGTDIDHLLIGPGGVFSLNTKNHLGKRVWVHTDVVKVNGQSRDYPRASAHEAQRVSRILSVACGFPVTVTGVVVILASALEFGGHPTKVQVVGRKDVVRWLRSRPAVLDAGDSASIYAVARQSTTWL